MPKQIENLFNINFNNSTYIDKKTDKAQAEIRNRALEKVNAMLGPLNESYAINIREDFNKNFDFKQIENDINMAMDIIKNGGTMYAMDIETTGSLLDNATDFERGLSGITEIGISQRSFKNVGGVVSPSDIKVVNNILLGINGDAVEYGKQLLHKVETQGWNSVTATERSTLERYARAGVSTYWDPLEKIYKVKSAGHYDPTDFVTIAKGFDKLTAIGAHQGIGTDIGNSMIQELKQKVIDMSSGRNQLLFHNGRAFDIPMMEKGLGFSFGNNILDTLQVMYGQNMDYIEEFYKHTPYGDTITEHLASLSSMSKSLGLDVSNAHTAVTDTSNHLFVATEKLGNGMSLIDIFNKKMNTVKSNTSIINNSNSLLYITNSIGLNGSKISKGSGFDYLSIKEPDGTERILNYQNWMLNRNRYYKVAGYGFISAEDLKNTAETKAIAKNISKGGNGLFALRLQSAATGSNEFVTIFRETQEEIANLLNGNVSLAGGITQGIIDEADMLVRNDNARRAWQGLFQVGNKGFDMADTYYSAYRQVNRAYKKAGGVGKLTQEQLESLVRTGKLHVGSNVLEANKALSKLGHSSGNLIFERVRNFVGMYNIIGDTEKTVSTLITDIKKNIKSAKEIKDIALINRTAALQIAMNQIAGELGLGNVIEQAQNVDKFNMIKKPTTLGDYGYMPFKNKDGRIIRSSISDKGTFISSMYGDLLGATKHTDNVVARKTIMNKRIKDIISFYRNEVFGSDSNIGKALSKIDVDNITDYSAITKTIGSQIYDEYHGLLKGFSNNDLIDIDSRIETLRGVGNKTLLPKLEAIKKIQSAGGDIEIFDLSGIKVGDLPFSTAVKSNSIDVHGIAKASTNHALSHGHNMMFPFSKGANGKSALNIGISHTMERYLGYGEEELKAISNFMGKINDFNKQGGEQLAVSLNKISSNGVDNFYLSIIAKDKSNNLRKRILNNELYDEAINIKLHKVNNINGLPVLEQGNIQRINLTNYGMYFNNKNATGNLAIDLVNDLRIAKDTSSGKALRFLDMKANSIIEAITTGKNIDRVNASVQRMYNSAINDAPSPTGYEIVDTVDGIKRMLIPNTNDFLSAKHFQMDELINLMPILYREDREFAGHINELLSSKANMSSEKTIAYMSNWLEGLQSGKWGIKKDYDKVLEPLRDYFTNLMLHGAPEGTPHAQLRTRLIDKMMKLPGIAGNSENLGYMKEVSQGNQMIKDTMVPLGRATHADYISANTGGVFSDLNRPPQIQNASHHSLILSNIGVGKINELKSNGIHIGQPIVDEYAIKEVYDKLKGANAVPTERGFSGIYKIMNEQEVYDAIESVFSDNNFTNELMKMQEMNGRSLEEVKNIFYLKAGTTEQGSILSPRVSNLYRTRALQTFSYDPMNVTLKEGIEAGSYVNYGDEIGTYVKNGKIEPLIYNKKSGIIKNINGGSLEIESKQFINEAKVIIGGTEKTIAQTFDPNDTIATKVWDKLFGSDVSIVGNFEALKHESASTVLFGDIQYIAQQVILNGNENERNKFIEMMGTHFKGFNAGFTTLREGTDFATEVLKINQKGSGVNVFKGYTGFMREFRGLNDGIFGNINQQMSGFTGTGGRTKSFVSMVFGQLNTEYNSQFDEESLINKGVKTTHNTRQIMGISVGSSLDTLKYYRDFQGGKYEKTAQILIDKDLDEALGSHSAARARRDLLNIQDAIRLNNGLQSNAVVVETTLDKINIPSGGIDIEDLADTFYGKFNDADVIKVNLNDDIINPFVKDYHPSGKIREFGKTRSIYIPVQQLSANIDGERFVVSESQKATANLLNSLQYLMSNKARGNQTLEQTKEQVNKAMIDLMYSWHNEFNGKNGLMMSNVLTGRLNYSGHELIGKIFAPLYDENGNHRNPLAKNTFMNIDGKNYAMDIAWLSEDSFKNKAGENFFRDLGYQLHNELDYNGGENYAKKLGLLGKLEDADYKAIGKKYAEEVGISGGILRYPTFLDQSYQRVMYRLNPLADSNSVVTMQHTAKKLNADTDADILGIKFMLDKGEDGRIRIYSRHHELTKAHETLMAGQAIMNGYYENGKWSENSVIADLINDMPNVDANSKVTPEEYIEAMKKKGRDGFSYLENTGISYTAVKTRYDKVAIGYASNPNKYMRDVAQEVYGDSYEGLRKLQVLLSFTNKTEQDPISIKHMRDEQILDVNRIALNTQYNKAINMMGKGDVDGGMELLLSTLKDSGYYKEGQMESSLKRLKETSFEKLGSHERGLKSIYDLFNTAKANELWNLPMLKVSPGDIDNVTNNLVEIGNMSANAGGTQIVQEKIKGLNYTEAPARHTSINNVYVGNGGVYSVVNSGISKSSGLSYAELQNVETGDNFRVYGGNSSEVGAILNRDYKGFNSLQDISSAALNSIQEKGSSAEADELARVLAVMKQRNLITEGHANETLSQYNEMIKRKGANAIDVKDNIVNNLLKDFNPNGRKEILGAAANFDLGSANIKATAELIEKIEGTKAYNLPYIQQVLASSAVETVEQLSQSYDLGDAVKNTIAKSMMYDPYSLYEKANETTIQNLNDDYKKLIEMNTQLGNDFLGWAQADMADEVASYTEHLEILRNQRIAAGEFVGARIQDLSMEDLRQILTQQGSDKNLIETKRRVSNYFSAIDNISAIQEPTEEISNLITVIKNQDTQLAEFTTSAMDFAVDSNKVLSDINETIKQEAKKLTDDPVEQIAKHSKMLDNKGIKAALIATAVIGTAGFITSQFTASSSALEPTKRPNGTGAPAPDGRYEDRQRPIVTKAPPSEKSIRLSQGDGVRFKVSGTINPNLTHRDIGEAIGATMRRQGNVNINVNSRDQSHVNQSWLEDQISNLL